MFLHFYVKITVKAVKLERVMCIFLYKQCKSIPSGFLAWLLQRWLIDPSLSHTWYHVMHGWYRWWLELQCIVYSIKAPLINPSYTLTHTAERASLCKPRYEYIGIILINRLENKIIKEHYSTSLLQLYPCHLHPALSVYKCLCVEGFIERDGSIYVDAGRWS